MDFSWELKTCYSCKQEKEKAIYFTGKERMCIACKKECNNRNRIKRGTDSSKSWRIAGFCP